MVSKKKPKGKAKPSAPTSLSWDRMKEAKKLLDKMKVAPGHVAIDAGAYADLMKDVELAKFRPKADVTGKFITSSTPKFGKSIFETFAEGTPTKISGVKRFVDHETGKMMEADMKEGTVHEWSSASLNTHTKVMEVIKKEGNLRHRIITINGYRYKLRVSRHPDDLTLNGYVGVEITHPLYEINIESDALKEISVHGGLTYGGHGFPMTERDLNKWWVWGFDSAHAGDYNPGRAITMDKMGGARSKVGTGFLKMGSESYKSMGFVMNETEKLAEQLAKLIAKEGELVMKSGGRIAMPSVGEGGYRPVMPPIYPPTAKATVTSSDLEEDPFDLLTGTMRAEAIGAMHEESRAVYESHGLVAGRELSAEALRRTERNARLRKADRASEGNPLSPSTIVVDKRIERKPELAAYVVTKKYADGHTVVTTVSDAEMEMGSYKIDEM